MTSKTPVSVSSKRGLHHPGNPRMIGSPNYYIPASMQNQVSLLFFYGKNEISTGIFDEQALL
jgi:hypothetical protein